MLWVDLTFEVNEDSVVFRIFIFIFFLFLEPTLRKDVYIRRTSATVISYGNFLKLLSWKLLDHSYVQSSLSTITSHIDSNILKDAWPLKILLTRMIMKQILTKVPAKLSLARKSPACTSKNISAIWKMALHLFL